MSQAMRKRLLEILRKNANRFDYGGIMMTKKGKPKKFKLRTHFYDNGKIVRMEKHPEKYSAYQKYVKEQMPMVREQLEEENEDLKNEFWFHRKIAEESMKQIGKAWTQKKNKNKNVSKPKRRNLAAAFKKLGQPKRMRKIARY